MKNRLKKPEMENGFTLVEIMIVVFIIALLAAIAIPNYSRHVLRTRATEAVASMSMIRQAMRDYFIVNNAYYDVTAGSVADATGINKQPTTGVAVDVGIAQYFSNKAFSVDGTSPTSARFSLPAAVDFIISVDGSASVPCGTSDCATNQSSITAYRLEMDNTGRTFVSYDSGTNWSSY
jgi:type IV pilus assembly protein PilE